jgi:hypothetical protein
MSNYIIYDLETSGLNFSNQILTYSFKQIDKDFKIIDACEGSIKIKRFEIPEPEAILANKIDVIEHQNISKDTEYEAMAKIHRWLRNKVESDKTYLMGKNSYRFDLPFLRTSMIRNGFNPYLGPNLVNRDLQHIIVQAFNSNKQYREQIRTYIDSHPDSRPNSLETVSKVLGVLSKNTKQTHNASDDVDLTINVLRVFSNKFFVSIDRAFIWEPYSAAKKLENENMLVAHVTFNKEDNYNYPVVEYFYPYQFKNSNALWINVSKLINTDSNTIEDYREYFKWINRNDGYFNLVELSSLIVSGVIHLSPTEIKEYTRVAEIFKNEMSTLVTLDNFFSERNCDIEQHIYRIPYQGIQNLGYAITTKNKNIIKECDNGEFVELYKRYYLNYCKEENLTQPKLSSVKENYINYRYGGGGYCYDPIENKIVYKSFKLDKFNTKDMIAHDDHPVFQRTFASMVSKLKDMERNCEDIKDKDLLRSLKEFYKSSLVGKHFLLKTLKPTTKTIKANILP